MDKKTNFCAEGSGGINSTRFKNKLLIAVPDLSAHVSGKDPFDLKQ